MSKQTARDCRHLALQRVLSTDGKTVRQLADATGLKPNRIYLDLHELEGEGKVLREYIEGVSYWFIKPQAPREPRTMDEEEPRFIRNLQESRTTDNGRRRRGIKRGDE